MSSVQNDRPAFKPRIEPNDLLSAIIVRPPILNERMKSQDGLFILAGLSKGKEEIKNEIENCVALRIKIPYAKKQSILNQLDLVGINQSTIYREFQKGMEYIKENMK